ncbi:TIGR02186 family protein [Roseococcus pinisoli]|uniref:TIGR02186 family protein n=1 Tax=Roseococcus pinisoli TaxID=2835040 RepID=A0ABS5QAL9_9PROT|nr:TIGR02186 family protein [Roseococcus pinisoli]MBS7810488.1 TIGR02186 family protein [Roseococcus pinisoli]
MSARRGWLLAAMLALLAGGFCRPAAAQTSELVARLSTERVAITTAFVGESILVFGSTEQPLGPGGDEVVVMARGPSAPFVVRRKVRVIGLWLNGPSARFAAVPSFYAIAGTRPPWQLLPEEARHQRGIGIDSIPLEFTGARAPGFRRALVELKRNSNLWQEDPSPIEIAGSRLFNFRLHLPSTVQPGTYNVEVMLVRARRVVATEQLGFVVERTGSAAEIEKVARGQPVIYALLCILAAAFAGWAGSVVFRRG